ncbi:MAG: type II toxin-antitoxin system RelE/ParE family toxin [Candidatus Poribacteria bacterium]|nr:type II toxin-antitoxin system RelE/ParE family toxin [Candidatus Poribacteria bacterium]
MHNTQPREIETYRTQNGREPFTEWFNAIRDTRTQTRIRGRLDRLEKGNFGDCESVGSGIFELRMHFGPGYRIYFGEVERTIVLLLCGGDKSTQVQDIRRAKTYWLEYKEEHR